MSPRPSRTARSLIFLFASLAATSALAAEADLQCFKIQDSLKLKTVLDIDTSALGLQPECKILKARFYCTPASPANVAVATVPIGGPPSSAKICYKVRCPKPHPSGFSATDLFATHAFTRPKPFLFCTSAFDGNPTAFQSHKIVPIGMSTLVADASTVTLTEQGGGRGVSGGRVLWSPAAPAVHLSVAPVDPALLPSGAQIAVRYRGPISGKVEQRLVITGSDVVLTANDAVPLPGGPGLRAGTRSCLGVPSGIATETVAGNPAWEWESGVSPETFSLEVDGADVVVSFEWSSCVPVEAPAGAGSELTDRLEIRLPGVQTTLPSVKTTDVEFDAGLSEIVVTGIGAP